MRRMPNAPALPLVDPPSVPPPAAAASARSPDPRQGPSRGSGPCPGALPADARTSRAKPRGFDWARVGALAASLVAHLLGAGWWLQATPQAPAPVAPPPATESVHERLTLFVDLPPRPPVAPPPAPPALPPPPPARLRVVPPTPAAATLDEPAALAEAAENARAPLTVAAASVPASGPPAPAAPPAPPPDRRDARTPLDPARARDERAAYVRALMAALLAQRSYPAQARRERARGVVALRFTLDRDGHVLASAIARSPGHAVLEQAALEVLRRADPLPAIPDALGVDRLTVTVPIEYSLITR